MLDRLEHSFRCCLGLTAVAAALCWASLDIVTASTIPEQFEGTVCTCGTLCFTALTCGFSPTLLRFVNRCLSLVKHLPMLTCAGVLSCAGGILYFWHSSLMCQPAGGTCRCPTATHSSIHVHQLGTSKVPGPVQQLAKRPVQQSAERKRQNSGSLCVRAD